METTLAIIKPDAYKKGYTHCITLDADSQHDPEYIKSFLQINKDISIVIGKREFNNEHKEINADVLSLSLK